MAAERASLSLVAWNNHRLWLHASQDRAAVGHQLRICLDAGIAGTVARSGEAIRVADAYQDARFNPDMDLTTGFKTRSIGSDSGNVPAAGAAEDRLNATACLDGRAGKPNN